jgi:hypothetical protein
MKDFCAKRRKIAAGDDEKTIGGGIHPDETIQKTMQANFRGLNKIGPRTCRCGSRFWQKEEVILYLAKGGPKSDMLVFFMN